MTRTELIEAYHAQIAQTNLVRAMGEQVAESLRSEARTLQGELEEMRATINVVRLSQIANQLERWADGSWKREPEAMRRDATFLRDIGSHVLKTFPRAALSPKDGDPNE